MKTIKEVQKDCIGNVYTLKYFSKAIDRGLFNCFDGIGYFHDGQKETKLSVWDNSLTWDDIKNFPYVCWYNK